jgi:hypothetical protein
VVRCAREARLAEASRHNHIDPPSLDRSGKRVDKGDPQVGRANAELLLVWVPQSLLACIA